MINNLKMEKTMKIEYRKIFNRNYAVIYEYNVLDYKECYRSKMLKSNKLDHFLTYDTQNINGALHFTYDISSKQSIYSFYENSDIDYETVRHLIMSLKAAFDTLNNYLLEPDYIVLDPKMIYMNIATKVLYFCYCPAEKNNFYESLNTLICYILSKINHEDTNCIILAYSLQQQSINTNYTFDDLMEILNKQVFNHQSSHINQKEQIQKNENEDIHDNSIYQTQKNSDTIPEYQNSEPFSEISKHFSKKNLKWHVMISVCIFLGSLSVILYYGLILQTISTELTVIFSGMTAFVCFELFTYLKSKQTDTLKRTSKLFKSEISSCSQSVKASFENKEYPDIVKNQTIKPPKHNLKRNNVEENNLWESDLIQNDITENNLWKKNLWKKNLTENNLKKHCSKKNTSTGENTIKNYSTESYSAEYYPTDNYSTESHSAEYYPTESYLTEGYPAENDLTNGSSTDNYSSESISNKHCSEKHYYEDTIILGYRSSESLPRLVYTGTDFVSENELVSFPFIIGKMTDNVNMTIDNPMISRIHAKIYLKEGHYYIEDMNSSNGTYINNTLIQPHSLTEINTGDYITFSHLTYIFQ